MIILGIETSCDETAASVVKDGREILSHVIASSAEMHVKTGGIVPEQAARQQVRSIIPVIAESIKSTTGTKGIKSIDALAVTVGPGLIGSLLVGVETAKTLAYVWNKPLVPVNHLTAHIYANWLAPELKTKNPGLPAVALVVSGGHTDLVLMKGHGKLEWLGGTRDDAAGEAFDKTARLLGLPYPGGPAIAKEAMKHQAPNNKSQTRLPRPMLKEDNFDFSFSGLKTAVIREAERLKRQGEWDEKTKALIAYEVQEAITDVLVEKTLRAVKKYRVPTLLLAGGVAANQRLKEKFEETMKHLCKSNWTGLDKRVNFKFKSWTILNKPAQWNNKTIDLRAPPAWLCTDNASYIASFAEYNFAPVPWQKITANPGLTIMGKA